MNIILEETKFSIKSENINNMLMSFKKTYPNDEDINSIEEVFRKFGYYIHMGKEGNITDIEAAEETKSPVIMGTAEVLFPCGPLEELSYFLIPMAKKQACRS